MQLARTARHAQNHSALLQIRRTTTTATSMQCYFFRAYQSSYTRNAVAPPGRHHMESPPIPDHPCMRPRGIIIPIISLSANMQSHHCGTRFHPIHSRVDIHSADHATYAIAQDMYIHACDRRMNSPSSLCSAHVRRVRDTGAAARARPPVARWSATCELAAQLRELGELSAKCAS